MFTKVGDNTLKVAIRCFLSWLALWVIDVWKCLVSNLNITSFCRRAILAAPNSAIFLKSVRLVFCVRNCPTRTSHNTSKWRSKETVGGEGHLKHIYIYIYMVCSYIVGQGSRTSVFPTAATQAISQANMMFQRHIHEFLSKWQVAQGSRITVASKLAWQIQ